MLFINDVISSSAKQVYEVQIKQNRPIIGNPEIVKMLFINDASSSSAKMQQVVFKQSMCIQIEQNRPIGNHAILKMQSYRWCPSS